MASKSAKADLGKWAEGEARKVLAGLSNDNLRFAWHRYPDSRSARNLIQTQPADFLVLDNRRALYQGHAAFMLSYHLEVKETAQKYRLPKDKISQWADLRKFWFAGVRPAALIFRSVYQDWVIMDETQLITPYDICPASFPFAGSEEPTFQTAAAALNHLFNKS